MRQFFRLQAASNVVALAIGLYLGLAIASIDGAMSLAKDWQTFAAGFLAIAAAWLTIQQMRMDDQRQEARHSEQLWSTRRRDRVRVAKAAVPSAADIKNFAEELEMTVNVARQVGPVAATLNLHYQTLLRKVGQVKVAIRPEVDEAADLFDREMLERFRNVGVSLEDILGQDLELLGPAEILYGDTHPDPIVEAFREAYLETLDKAEELANWGIELAADLDRLWLDYKDVAEVPSHRSSHPRPWPDPL